MTRLVLVFKAFFQLGWRKSLLFGLYQLLLKVGIYKLLTPINQKPKLIDTTLHIPFDLPAKEEMLELLEREGLGNITDWANELVNGEIHPFGWEKHPLDLNPGTSLKHWTQHKGSQHNGQDIKFTWEPARFGWATMLSRAYFLTGDEKYTDAFWRYFDEFQIANPVNQGPNWASAQEVGLRLMHWVFCYAVFQHSPNTSEARKQSLAHAIAQHAQRIPPTLLYARAQNNNHLLSEAAALYTAALALPHHLHAKKWRTLGWRWFNWGIQNQIAENGAYMQHSTTYHRLMLTLALWMNLLVETQPESFPAATQTKLAAATEWLTSMQISNSGNVPNLGPNDGARIFEYSSWLGLDFVSVIQAAQAAFTEIRDYPLHEFARWFVHQPKFEEKDKPWKLKKNAKSIIYNQQINSAIYLRTPTFTDRPGHADLLHADLWRNDRHVTLDPGTYLYNANPPWDNALQGTDVHNTVMVNGEHQMTKASRFLWLDWPTTEILSVGSEDIPASITAQHNGYKKFGITHRRTVTAENHQWVVKDTLFAKKENQQASARLHWLLPDSEYTIQDNILTLTKSIGHWYWGVIHPEYPISIDIQISTPATLTLARAGELLNGEGTVEPHRGWYSSTYAHKTPALSLAYETQGALPITLTTIFTFPH